MNSFTTYPQYVKGMYGDTSFYLERPYSFKYHTDYGLEDIDSTNNIIKKPDALYSEDWTFDIYVSRTISVRNANDLFGPNGIVCKSARIGLCLMWASSSSYQRKVFEIGEVKDTQDEQVFAIEEIIEKSTIRGLVKFFIALYIKKEGYPTTNELHLANKQGSIIGILDEAWYELDPVSPFPIVHCVMENHALWDVRCSWEDISDNFNDTVAIIFNSKHKLFKYINKLDAKNFDINLVREILASALIQIILKYKESDENFDQLKIAKEGSVADYVRFYIDEWGVDTTSLNVLSKQLRFKLEQKISTLQ